MGFIVTFLFGLALYIFVRVIATALYTIRPDERAVITSFGRVERLSLKWCIAKQVRVIVHENGRHLHAET